MNHLAHLHLAGPSGLDRVANLSGDFLQGLATAPHPDLRAGIALHRAIDRFTDAHPLPRRSRARLAAPFRRWSAVLVDVFYDHFLARDWQRWHDMPFDAFRAMVYGELERHAAVLPPRLHRVAPTLCGADWLVAYATVDGVDTALARMAERPRRENPLREAGGELRRAYAGLDADFACFYPELIAHVRSVADDQDAARTSASTARRGSTARSM